MEGSPSQDEDEADFSQFGITPMQDLYGESDVLLIKQALINERAAPELLEYQADLVERLEGLINGQEDAVQLYDQGSESELIRYLYATELARVRYLLRAYLRCRLHKLERHFMYVLDHPDQVQKLSPKEHIFAQDFFLLVARHMKESVLKHLPPEFKELVKQSNASASHDMVPEPNLSSHVFCRVLEDCGIVELDDDGIETAEFLKDDLYVVRYHIIQEKVRDRWVQLI